MPANEGLVVNGPRSGLDCSQPAQELRAAAGLMGINPWWQRKQRHHRWPLRVHQQGPHRTKHLVVSKGAASSAAVLITAIQLVASTGAELQAAADLIAASQRDGEAGQQRFPSYAASQWR